MSNVLITGANRGIGLEFARQYSREGWTVFGTVRDRSEADELKELSEDGNGTVEVLEADLLEPSTLDEARDQVARHHEGLDLLVNNAGTYGSREGFEDLTDMDFETVFDVNCLGAFRVTRRFLPLLEEARGNVVFITSLMGSIEDNRSGGSYPYRISKAALNMLGRTFAVDYRSRDIHALLLHPGWVQTRMGGEEAPVPVDESVAGMRQVIDRLDESMSGGFYGYDGDPRPW